MFRKGRASELIERYPDYETLRDAIRKAKRAFDLGYTNALPMLRRLKKIQRATAR